MIDNDGLHGNVTRQVTLDLEAGVHPLEVLYFERWGDQTLELEWQGPDTGGQLQVLTGESLVHDPSPAVVPEPEPDAESSAGNTGLAAEYFILPAGVSKLSDIDFTAAPDATDVVGALDMAKSTDPFWQGGAADNFAARYTGALVVEKAGRYTLYLTSDDGSALYLDGARVIDNDGLHGNVTREVTLDLEAGLHQLEVLYFERGGAQTLELEWQGPDTGGLRQTVDGTALEYEGTAAEPKPDSATQLSIAGQAYDLLDQAAAQQGTAQHTLTEDGSGVTLTDNGWKAVEGNFEVTEDTVLSFTFAADVIGEIHGIGFANGASLQPGTFFKLAGTQPWGLESGEWQYVPGSGAVAVSIEVGKHFTGTFDRLVLGMDDDGEVGADSTFADIDIGVVAQTPVNTPPEAVDDSFTTGHGTPLVLDAADLLANDGDADGDTLSVAGVQAIAGGSVTQTGDTILFTPDAGFEGTATFGYSVSDGAAVSNATVSVDVAAPGHAATLLAAVPEGVGLSDPSLAVGLANFSYWKSPPF